MRTTLTLDSDVFRLVEEAVHRERRPMKQVVNDALRRGLTRPAASSEEPYELVAHESELQPGVDPGRLNQLADELEDEAVVAKLLRTP
jgi:hypothetical protein